MSSANPGRWHIAGATVALLLAVACAPQATPTTTAPAEKPTQLALATGVAQVAPNPTEAALGRLREQMNDIDPAIAVRVGDKLPDLALPITYPNGSTKTLSLRQETAGQRTILYFYVQDNTPL